MSFSVTKSTVRKASARCTCAVSRIFVSKRKSTAAATSAVCVPVLCLFTQIVGMGEAYCIAKEEMESEMAHLRTLRNRHNGTA